MSVMVENKLRTFKSLSCKDIYFTKPSSWILLYTFQTFRNFQYEYFTSGQGHSPLHPLHNLLTSSRKIDSGPIWLSVPILLCTLHGKLPPPTPLTFFVPLLPALSGSIAPNPPASSRCTHAPLPNSYPEIAPARTTNPKPESPSTLTLQPWTVDSKGGLLHTSSLHRI